MGDGSGGVAECVDAIWTGAEPVGFNVDYSADVGGVHCVYELPCEGTGGVDLGVGDEFAVGGRGAGSCFSAG